MGDVTVVSTLLSELRTHPRHEGEDVVLLVLDAVIGILLFTLLRAAEPNRPGLQLLPPPTHVDQAVTAAEGEGGRQFCVKQTKHIID